MMPATSHSRLRGGRPRNLRSRRLRFPRLPRFLARPAILLALVLAPVAAHAQTGALAEALELFHQGRYLDAETHLQALLNNEPENETAKTFLALTQASTGRCNEAAGALQLAFDKGSDEGLQRLAGLGLARCHIASGQFDKAFAALYRLKQLHPEDADVLYETARAQMKAWNGVVQEMFEKTPASFRVNQLSAEIFEIQGRYSEAVAEYRKAIEKAPNTLNLHYRLGRALLMESHEPEALQAARREFEAELALNPNDAVAHYQIAQIFEAQQNSGEATPSLERAVAIDPDFPEALIALGRARLAANRHDDAISLLEKAIQLTPQSESAHYALMLAYRNAGRREDAQKQSRRLNELQKSPEGEFTEFLKRIGEQPGEP